MVKEATVFIVVMYSCKSHADNSLESLTDINSFSVFMQNI